MMFASLSQGLRRDRTFTQYTLYHGGKKHAIRQLSGHNLL
jgi:hypothetical protein